MCLRAIYNAENTTAPTPPPPSPPPPTTTTTTTTKDGAASQLSSQDSTSISAARTPEDRGGSSGWLSSNANSIYFAITRTAPATPAGLPFPQQYCLRECVDCSNTQDIREKHCRIFNQVFFAVLLMHVLAGMCVSGATSKRIIFTSKGRLGFGVLSIEQ